MPYQPQNPYMPYGGMRSSKTGSRAVAGMQEPSYAPFQGIGSLPNVPVSNPAPLQGQAQAVRTAPLQGGLGKVMANGYEVGTTGINQLKTRGRYAVPAADSMDSLNSNYRGGRYMARQIQQALNQPPGPDMITEEDLLRQNNPDVRQYVKDQEFAIRHGGQRQSFGNRFDGVIPDPRSGGNSAYVDAVSTMGISPNDPRYVDMLLHGTPQDIRSTKGLGYDKLYNPDGTPKARPQEEPLPGEMPMTRDYPQPLPVEQPLPEELTAQALPMDQVVNNDGFGMRVPQMDDSMPGDNGFGPLPADLQNPFQDVSNEAPRPRGLTREDDLNNGFDPNDPYQQYAMPRYSGGEDPFYKGVNNVAMAGLDNKQRMDQMRWDDWNRAKTEQGWNDFAGSVLTPLAGVFAKDPNVRARIQQTAQGQLGAYDRERQLRNSERQQQFGEDKYYTDIRQANDPNSYENWLAGQNATTNRLNAATGVTNARSNQQYRQDMINSRQDETDRKAAWDQWKMRHGDNQDSWNAFNSLVRQNQGQQRIDNQQNQFTAKQAQQDAQFQRAQALREQQAQQQIAESQNRLAKAIKDGDAKAADLELQRQRLLMEVNRRDKDGNFIYPDETAAQLGAPRSAEPEPAPKQNIIDQLSAALGMKAKPKSQIAGEAPAPAPKKNIVTALGSEAPKVFNRNNEKHKALVQEAKDKFGDNVDQAKAWLRAKGLKV